MEREFRTLIACLRHAIGPEKMVLAGGTTLEMLWRHRESTDIELFVSNATIIEIAKRGTAELERATARIDKVGEARTGGGARGLVEGTIQGVTFSIAGSDHIAWRRKPTARVSGTAVQCGTVEEVLSGKVLGRWVDRVKRGPAPDEWAPVRDVYDVAVAKALAPDILQAVVAKIGEGTRGTAGRMAGGDTRRVDPEGSPKGAGRTVRRGQLGRGGADSRSRATERCPGNPHGTAKS